MYPIWATISNEGDIGDQTQVPSGFAVPTLIGKRDANYQPNFDEVKDKVTDKYKQEQAKNRLEQFAKDLISSAGSAGGLKAAAEKLGLEAKTNDKYKLGGSFDTLGNSAAADDALFALKDGQVVSAPVRVDESYLVVGLTKRTDADMSKFEEQKASLTDSALTTRRNQVFEDYITALEQKMKASGDIKIDRETLTLMQEEAPAPPPPPRRNNLPFQPPQ
jgi:parvulin-like peptidyl-prolyl isomerase